MWQPEGLIEMRRFAQPSKLSHTTSRHAVEAAVVAECILLFWILSSQRVVIIE